MPVSSTISLTGRAPISASQSATALRRPFAATTSSASSSLPSSSRTPVTVGPTPKLVAIRSPGARFATSFGLGFGVAASGSLASRPTAARPVRMVTLASASAARRRTHSKVVRRQAIITRSSSPGSGSNSISGGTPSPNRISVAPSASNASRMSGWWSRSRFRNRARKAWLWRTCGAPRRFHSNASSAVSGIGVSSRSITVTL